MYVDKDLKPETKPGLESKDESGLASAGCAVVLAAAVIGVSAYFGSKGTEQAPEDETTAAEVQNLPPVSSEEAPLLVPVEEDPFGGQTLPPVEGR